mgnify:CR=1 FL=1
MFDEKTKIPNLIPSYQGMLKLLGFDVDLSIPEIGTLEGKCTHWRNYYTKVVNQINSDDDETKLKQPWDTFNKINSLQNDTVFGKFEHLKRFLDWLVLELLEGYLKKLQPLVGQLLPSEMDPISQLLEIQLEWPSIIDNQTLEKPDALDDDIKDPEDLKKLKQVVQTPFEYYIKKLSLENLTLITDKFFVRVL